MRWEVKGKVQCKKSEVNAGFRVEVESGHEVGCERRADLFLAGAGFAGSSTLLSAARPYLLGISVLFIAYGFYQARRATLCGRRPSILTSLLLWLSTAIVVMAVFFPQVMANAVASLLAR